MRRKSSASLIEVILGIVVVVLIISFTRSRGCFSPIKSVVTVVRETKEVGSYRFPDYQINTDAGGFVVFTSGEFIRLDGMRGKCLRIEYKEGSKSFAPTIKRFEEVDDNACKPSK